jgi:hypothetical protein
MDSIILIPPKKRSKVLVHQAITRCSFFRNNPSLRTRPYQISFPAPLIIFDEFISALEGHEIEITDANMF